MTHLIHSVVRLFFLIYLSSFLLCVSALPRMTPELQREVASLKFQYHGAEFEDVIWTYPVFTGANSPRLEKLNSWLRKTSLEGLTDALGEGPDIELIAAKTNQQIIDQFKLNLSKEDLSHKVISDISKISTASFFGQYFQFGLTQCNLGLARQHCGGGVLFFDYLAGVEVPIEDFFKEGSETALSELFQAAATKQLTPTKKEIQSCKRSPTPACEGMKEVNAEICWNNRNFHWGNLSIQNSQTVHADYPHEPIIHAICGYDFVFTAIGRKVEKLFLKPELFKAPSFPAEITPSAVQSFIFKKSKK